MRKIEREMNTAIANKIDWRKDNTEVQYLADRDVSVVYLHNNKIAEIGENFIQLFDGGFQSVTTKSRLNAILRENGITGECVFQQNYKWKFRTWDNVIVDFFSGMRLN